MTFSDDDVRRIADLERDLDLHRTLVATAYDGIDRAAQERDAARAAAALWKRAAHKMRRAAAECRQIAQQAHDAAMQAYARVAGAEQERDDWHRLFSEVLKEHHELMNGMLEGLDLEIDEDGPFILTQIVKAATRAHAAEAALVERTALLAELFDYTSRLARASSVWFSAPPYARLPDVEPTFVDRLKAALASVPEPPASDLQEAAADAARAGNE